MRESQQKKRCYEIFLRETDTLAHVLGCGIDDLPAVIGVSKASFYGYRKGNRNISAKAWAKLDSVIEKNRVPKSEMMDDLRKEVNRHRLTIHNFWIDGAGAAVVLGQAADELSGDLGAEAERMSARVRETSTPAIEALRGLCAVVAQLMGDEPAEDKAVVYEMNPRRDKMVAEDSYFNGDQLRMGAPVENDD